MPIPPHSPKNKQNTKQKRNMTLQALILSEKLQTDLQELEVIARRNIDNPLGDRALLYISKIEFTAQYTPCNKRNIDDEELRADCMVYDCWRRE